MQFALMRILHSHSAWTFPIIFLDFVHLCIHALGCHLCTFCFVIRHAHSRERFPFNFWHYEFLELPKLIFNVPCVLNIVQNVYTLRARLQFPFCGFCCYMCIFEEHVPVFAGANCLAFPLSGRVCRGFGFGLSNP